MTPEPIDVTCPSCAVPFAVAEAGEAECPRCGWEFGCDGDGRVTDDNDLDAEGPFGVDAEGELDAEGLQTVACPRCHCRFEVGESGVTVCPRCLRLLAVDDLGRAVDGTPEWAGDEDEDGDECHCFGAAPPWDDIDEEDLAVHAAECQGWWVAPLEDAEEPAPAAPPGLPVPLRTGSRPVLTVAADGGGEFATIRDALRRAPSGARILVKPGLYRERLRFDPTSRPVEIVGDGPAGAVRVEAPNGPALEVAGGAVEVRRLTLAARRQAPRPVVRVTAGRPLLDDCLIVGGGTAAVVACGPAAQPVLRGCRLHDARKVGLLVDDRARALMEGGRLADHGRAGAEVVFGGRLELRGVTVRDNGGPGVLARPFTEVRLTDGVIAANAGAGLSGRQAVVRASGVQFEDGRSVGVRVVGGLVLLERCTVRGHARANVAVRRFSKAWLRGCRLEEGRSHGLRIVGPSQTLLDDCTVTANAGKGVVVRRQGCPHLRRCRIHDNGGVALDLPARAVVDLNACRLGERWKVADGATVRLYRPAGV